MASPCVGYTLTAIGALRHQYGRCHHASSGVVETDKTDDHSKVKPILYVYYLAEAMYSDELG